MNMSENNLKTKIDEKKQNTYKFRKFPGFIRLFRFSSVIEGTNHQIIEKYVINNFSDSHTTSSNTLKKSNHNIKLFDVIFRMKIGFFKFGNIIGSFWFGIFLFAMQSYFLRQNLGLTNNNFSSS